MRSISRCLVVPSMPVLRSCLVVSVIPVCFLLGIARAAAFELEFLELHQDSVAGVTDLRLPNACSVSPDGHDAYVVTAASNSVVHFTRAPSGRLAFAESYVNGAGPIHGLFSTMGVATSPDGVNVYTASQGDSAVAVFERVPVTGALVFLEAHVDGVAGVDGLERAFAVLVSPDSDNVYVSGIDDNAVAAFSRDPASGALTFIDAYVNNVGGVTHMSWPLGLAMDTRGETLYVATLYGAGVAVFDRSPADGSLTFAGAYTGTLNGCGDVVLSPDDAFLYVSDYLGDAVVVLGREPSTGALVHLETHHDGDAGVTGLDAPLGLVMDPHGRWLAAVSGDSDSVAFFDRNPADGRLAFREAEVDGVNGVDGLLTAQTGCTDITGSTLYVAGWDDHAVPVFAVVLFADGFEAGDLGAWSDWAP